MALMAPALPSLERLLSEVFGLAGGGGGGGRGISGGGGGGGRLPPGGMGGALALRFDAT